MRTKVWSWELTEIIVGGLLASLLHHAYLGHLVVHLVDDKFHVVLQFQVVEGRDALIRNSYSRCLPGKAWYTLGKLEHFTLRYSYMHVSARFCLHF